VCAPRCRKCGSLASTRCLRYFHRPFYRLSGWKIRGRGENPSVVFPYRPSVTPGYLGHPGGGFHPIRVSGLCEMFSAGVNATATARDAWPPQHRVRGCLQYVGGARHERAMAKGVGRSGKPPETGPVGRILHGACGTAWRWAVATTCVPVDRHFQTTRILLHISEGVRIQECSDFPRNTP
jgi:hypothetical protein